MLKADAERIAVALGRTSVHLRAAKCEIASPPSHMICFVKGSSASGGEEILIVMPQADAHAAS